jgi:tetratricopeptide (TPR) repeat protein
MKIAFCGIVKDDSELVMLQNMLASVIPYVDSVHITANGKEAAGIEAYIKSLEVKYPYKVVDYTYLAWNSDFGEQRNFNFSRAPKDTDFIFWMDADDLLVGGENLRPACEIAKKNGKDVVFLEYWYGCEFNGAPSKETFKKIDIKHFRERLIRPGTITWKGRLHETPMPVDGQRDQYTKIPYNNDKPLAIMHTASLDDAFSKIERNRTILESQLEDERRSGQADPRTLLYLMKIYAEVGGDELLRKCIEMGEEYLTKSGWDEERANCCDLMSICYSKMDDYDNTIKFLHKAISEYPHGPLHYIRLALAYYNKERYREAKHWLTIAGNLDLDSQTAGITNIKEMKVLFSQLALKLAYNVDKDHERALVFAKKLVEEQDLPEHRQDLVFLENLVDWKRACVDARKLLTYLEEIGEETRIVPILESLPEAIAEQPFGIQFRQKYTKPRIWKDNEICYFANFGGAHFEMWDSTSLVNGIGGSETAVIRLSQEWTKAGYKVTVYGDPKKKGEQNGVTYLPWYYFNRADKFNIFIQWRNPVLGRTIKAKKFYVDLHDMVSQVDYSKETVDALDGVFFKSQYHRNLLPELPESKAFIIGNGIQQ